jgi:hypothetical protein
MQERSQATPIGNGSSSGAQLRDDARMLRLAELPPPNTKRWVIRRKAEVVAAVRSGVLTLEDACTRYKLSLEEFLSWQRLIDSHGLAGLRVTRLQDYRSLERAPSGRP